MSVDNRTPEAVSLTPRLRRIRLTGDDLTVFDPLPGQERPEPAG